MVSMSAMGSILPATCTMSGCSKQRTTCAMASTSRMCARNLLPSPSPCDAPATSPAMSTNSTEAGMIFCGCTMSASCARRGSGTGTTPTFGSIVQNGKFAAAMPALVRALKSVDLPTLGRPTMPHWMAIQNLRAVSGKNFTPSFRRKPASICHGCRKIKVDPGLRRDDEQSKSVRVPSPESRVPARMQPLRRLVESAHDDERQHVQRTRDRIQHRVFVRCGRIAEHPRRHAIAVARVADADAQAMELPVPELRDNVADAVLAAVAAVEFQTRGAGRQIQVVVHDQQFFGRELPVIQRRHDRAAAFVHEGCGFDHPHLLAADRNAASLRVQAILETETLPRAGRQHVGKPEAGVVAVAQIFGPGVAEAGDEADARHSEVGSGDPNRLRPGPPSRRNHFFSAGFLSPAAGAAAFAASPPAGAAAPSAAAPSAAPSAGASSTSSRTACADTTVWSYSLPSFSSGISTPAGSLRSDTCTTSPSASSLRSRSMCSGRSFGKHDTSTSVWL